MRAGRDSKAAREAPQDDSAASANTPQVGWVTLVKSGKKLVDFLKAIKEPEAQGKLTALKAEVEAWAGKWPMPGH